MHWNKEGFEEQFTEEEIEEAAFDLAGDKSPDPDGNQIFSTKSSGECLRRISTMYRGNYILAFLM